MAGAALVDAHSYTLRFFCRNCVALREWFDYRGHVCMVRQSAERTRGLGDGFRPARCKFACQSTSQTWYALLTCLVTALQHLQSPLSAYLVR